MKDRALRRQRHARAGAVQPPARHRDRRPRRSLAYRVAPRSPAAPPPRPAAAASAAAPARRRTVAVGTGENLMALTFDDGPDPDWTPRLLDLLARHGAKATFFMVGSRAARHPELVARVAAEGHEIGNHTGTIRRCRGSAPRRSPTSSSAPARRWRRTARRCCARPTATRTAPSTSPRAASATARSAGTPPARTGSTATPRPSPACCSTRPSPAPSCCCTIRSIRGRRRRSATGRRRSRRSRRSSSGCPAGASSPSPS